MNFIYHPPVPKNTIAFWIIYPSEDAGGLCIGEDVSLENVWKGKNMEKMRLDNFNLETVYTFIKIIYMTIEKGNICYITGRVDNLMDIAACFLKQKYKMEDSRILLEKILSSSPIYQKSGYRIDLITKIYERYQRSLKILVCGDRNAHSCFEEQIKFELKQLPKFSTLIHGGCSGVDSCADRIARELSIDVVCYKADWGKYGYGAGPIRNLLMLDKEEPDLVLAFHEDIENSKGTKDMILKSYTKTPRPHIYLITSKRKSDVVSHFFSFGYGSFEDI